jgi:cytochrome-b5 reductase
MGEKNIIITPYRILDIDQITHDTKQFRFSIPSENEFIFLPGDHMKIYPDRNDPVEFRPYTPTTIPGSAEYYELIIKRYPDGMVSRFIHDRKVGEEISMSGPHVGGHFIDGMAREIGLIAGGTGITPMISIIRYIITKKLDVSISLLFANKTVDDIILQDEFDDYAEKYPNFMRFYLLDSPPPEWNMGKGRITVELMKQHMPGPSANTTIFVCGPPMMQLDIRKNLIGLGHTKDKIIFP